MAFMNNDADTNTHAILFWYLYTNILICINYSNILTPMLIPIYWCWYIGYCNSQLDFYFEISKLLPMIFLSRGDGAYIIQSMMPRSSAAGTPPSTAETSTWLLSQEDYVLLRKSLLGTKNENILSRDRGWKFLRQTDSRPSTKQVHWTTDKKWKRQGSRWKLFLRNIIRKLIRQ